MNARFYVPGVGRFASADTIVPDPVNPKYAGLLKKAAPTATQSVAVGLMIADQSVSDLELYVQVLENEIQKSGSIKLENGYHSTGWGMRINENEVVSQSHLLPSNVSLITVSIYIDLILKGD